MEVETSANAADGTNVNASLLRRIEELENNLRDSRTKIAELEGELQKSQAREQVLHQRLSSTELPIIEQIMSGDDK